MLTLLRLKNIAIFEDVEIELSPGMNILTGETGAGKSVALKAIALLSGERANSDLVRTGCSQCEIEGLFDLSPDRFKQIEQLKEYCQEGELVVRKVITAAGRNRNYIAGKLVSQKELAQIGSLLIDITGQHYALSLVDKKNYCSLLDSFGIETELLQRSRDSFSAWISAKKLRVEHETLTKERSEYIRRISFERDELLEFGLREGEREELESALNQQESIEFLCNTAKEGLELLDSDDGILRQLAPFQKNLTVAAQNSPSFVEAAKLLESAELQLSEAVREIQNTQASLVLDPEELENSRTRLTDIIRLERKYSKPSEELILYLTSVQEELSMLESGELDADKLRAKEAECLEVLHAVHSELTAARKEVAVALSLALEKELRNLDMKKARFKVELKKGESSAEGCDSIDFLLAANPGEPFRPLQKVASGGELSRVVLILKTLLNAKNSAYVQVFDEVDSGVGGAVAQTIAEKLKLVSRKAQVILVSHSPQIASFADEHFYVSKKTVAKRTSASAIRLDLDARVDEVARMLAGKNVSGNFISSARELLAEGQGLSKNSKKAFKKEVQARK